jgi:hypothetical protein
MARSMSTTSRPCRTSSCPSSGERWSLRFDSGFVLLGPGQWRRRQKFFCTYCAYDVYNGHNLPHRAPFAFCHCCSPRHRTLAIALWALVSGAMDNFYLGFGEDLFNIERASNIQKSTSGPLLLLGFSASTTACSQDSEKPTCNARLQRENLFSVQTPPSSLQRLVTFLESSSNS